MQSEMKQHRLEIDHSLEISAIVDLRILETTDLHVHLHPYDYYADCPNPDLGLSRLAELIDQARQQAPNCLLFDNGDFLQGTPVGDFFAYDTGARRGDLHPVMAAMNALQYDAMTLGNHEFSYGLDFLMRSLEQAEFPVVSANILHKLGAQPRKDRHLVKPYRLLRRQITDRAGRAHPICIGVIGCAPAQITLWERQHLNGRIQTRDMVEAVAAWVPEMREAGADLVVLLAHTGIGPIRHTENMENAIIPLCGIEGVDVVLSGHTHQVFPSPLFADIPGIDVARGTICGKPTVMSGFYGSHLGVIDLQMVRTGAQWDVLDVRVATHALRDAATQFAPITAQPRKVPLLSPKVRKIIERAHSSVLENIRQPIGQTETAINSFFVYLGQSAATALVAAAQREVVAQHMADTGLRDLPLLSAVSPSKAGGLGGANNFTHIKPGVLTLRSLADLYVFPNRVAASRLTGAQVALWLERSVSAYARLEPNSPDQMLMNPDFPGYNFEIIYGLTYEVDLSAPARFGSDGAERKGAEGRIRNLMWKGKPVDMAAEFIICTNSFRAQGAGGFAGTGPQSVVLELPATTRDILRDHVSGNEPLVVDPQAPFKLIAGAQAVLHTSISAHAHLDMIAQFSPEILGADERGFLRLRVKI
jgi:2',3'-cyclic-nucleotide 2'-phosphodiesterase / 3'-nucleotidase